MRTLKGVRPALLLASRYEELEQAPRNACSRSLRLALPQGADQIPLAHLRATPDVALLREVVELLARPVLEGVTGAAAASTRGGSLPSEITTRALRQVRDRPLTLRRRPRPLDVLAGGLGLFPGSHERSPSWMRSPAAYPFARSLHLSRFARRARRAACARRACAGGR